MYFVYGLILIRSLNISSNTAVVEEIPLSCIATVLSIVTAENKFCLDQGKGRYVASVSMSDFNL
jgi:hypothetical protein